MVRDRRTVAGVEPRPSMRVLGRGLARRCPNCGERRVFETWFRLAERCPACAARLEREPGFFLGAYFLNICVTQGLLVALLAGTFAVTRDPPLVPLLAAGAAICLVVPLLAYPFTKTTWAALHLAMAPLEPDEEADAAAHRFERGDAGAP